MSVQDYRIISKNKDDYSRDIMYEILYGENVRKLNFYTMICLGKMKNVHDFRISQLVDHVMKNFHVLGIYMKRYIIIYSIFFDNSMRHFICDCKEERRSHPPLDSDVQRPFFLGLEKLFKFNSECKLTDQELLKSVQELYNYIMTISIK